MKDLMERIKDLEHINETHQQLNGELRIQLQKLESEYQLQQNKYYISECARDITFNRGVENINDYHAPAFRSFATQ